MSMPQRAWLVYILECGDGTLYTGITNDLENRIAAHNAGLGARYTRGRGPVRLVYSEPCTNRSDASKRERLIKRLTAAEKRVLIAARL